jgi:hypothetical protein
MRLLILKDHELKEKSWIFFVLQRFAMECLGLVLPGIGHKIAFSSFYLDRFYSNLFEYGA